MRALLLSASLLAACGDPGVQPPRAARADSADQVLDTMKTTIMRNGRRVSDVEADTAWIYQSRQIADLKKVKVTFFDSNGTVISTVTAQTGVYNIGRRNLDARGNVVVVTPSGKILKTEHLVYNQTTGEISSDTAFTSTSPQGNGSGASFVSDLGFKNVQVVHPKAVQKGKGILLPGQGGGSSQ